MTLFFTSARPLSLQSNKSLRYFLRTFNNDRKLEVIARHVSETWHHVVILAAVQGGAFYFLEHVVSAPDSWTFFFQQVLEHLWYHVGDGCRITRATWTDLETAGFSDIHLTHIEAQEVTVLVRPHIMGYAIK